MHTSFARHFIRVLAVALLLAGSIASLMVAGPQTASAASSLHYLYGSGSATGGKFISLRIELTEPAPAGGALVQLSSGNPLIPVPATVLVPAGTTQRTIHVRTVPTPVSKLVRVSASYGGVTKSRIVVVLKPYLSSISVQSRMRAGGQGKIIVRLSGRAYTGGIDVTLASNRPSVVAVPLTVHIPEGQASYTLIVNPSYQLRDIPVTFTAQFDHRRLSGATLVRWYSNTFTATPTASATVTGTPTNTATNTPTASA